jgi:hypothetical protein
MSDIPLDLQRRFEQRWAGFARPTPSAAPQGHQPESQNQQLAAPAEAEEKAGRVEAAGLMSVAAACERGDVA